MAWRILGGAGVFMGTSRPKSSSKTKSPLAVHLLRVQPAVCSKIISSKSNPKQTNPLLCSNATFLRAKGQVVVRLWQIQLKWIHFICDMVGRLWGGAQL